MPQPRPRVSRTGGVFYPPTFAAYLGDVQRALAQSAARGITGPQLVVVESVMKRPKTTQFELPVGDVDNLAKVPLDVMQKVGILEDDRDVQLLVSFKRYARQDEDPHTAVHMGGIHKT